jgi:two-component system response regulator AtoC
MNAIVLVDDEPALARVLGMILNGSGIPCEVFTEPEKAIAYIEANEVGLVVCDYRMPTMSGIMMLARVKRPVKCIVMTGELGADHLAGEDPRIVTVLQKPILPEELLSTIRAHLA